MMFRNALKCGQGGNPQSHRSAGQIQTVRRSSLYDVLLFGKAREGSLSAHGAEVCTTSPTTVPHRVDTLQWENDHMDNEVVWFYFYQHKPRIKVWWSVVMRTVPIKGDIVTLPKEAFTQVGANVFERDCVKTYGATMVVTERHKHFRTGCGEDWRITLEPQDPKMKVGHPPKKK